MVEEKGSRRRRGASTEPSSPPSRRGPTVDALEWLGAHRPLAVEDAWELEDRLRSCFLSGGPDAVHFVLWAASARDHSRTLAEVAAVVQIRMAAPPITSGRLRPRIAARLRGDERSSALLERLVRLERLLRRLEVPRSALLAARARLDDALFCDGTLRIALGALAGCAAIPYEQAEVLAELLGVGCDCELILNTWLDR